MGKGDILAEMPKDEGKIIYCGGYKITVKPTDCEGYNCVCSNSATIWLQAETDSMGFEVWIMCEDCHKKCL